jgi:(E)-4-hydroxy-3-methylbut-2-enyl-diphosphate synthase
MVYAAGKTDHTIDSGDMIERIIGLVEKKAAALEAEKDAVPVAAE